MTTAGPSSTAGRFNRSAGRPAHFTELPLTVTVGPYGRGVESVYDRDPHAGALVSMHWSGFSTSRWGAGGAHATDDPLALDVVARCEARWMPALRQAWGNRGRRSEFDAATWHAYEVLQAVDLLSLGLGLIDLETPGTRAEPIRIERTLSSLDQAPGPRTVTSAPERAGGAVVTLAMRVVASDAGAGARVEIEPWPLDGPELELAMPVRAIEDRVYESAADAEAVYQTAAVTERRVTLMPAETDRPAKRSVPPDAASTGDPGAGGQ